MKLEVGKLYQCKEYYLMLYPDQETAAKVAYNAAAAATTIAAAAKAATARAAAARAAAEEAATARAAAHWSKRFGKPVFYIEKNIPLLVLNSKEKYIEVLAGDRKGWIMYEGSLNIKEIDYV